MLMKLILFCSLEIAIKIFRDMFLAQEQIGKGLVDRISQSPELKLPTEVAQIQDLIPS